MKLSKVELQAVAEKIYKELRATADKAQEEHNIICDAANKKKAADMFTKMQTLPPVLYKVLNAKRVDQEDILRCMRTQQTVCRYPDYSDQHAIYTALVIAQIESPDLASMIDKIKEQFGKI